MSAIPEAAPRRYRIHTICSAQAQRSPASSTHITLASSDLRSDGYYINSVIAFVEPDGITFAYGLVTGYVASTKVATVVGWAPATIAGPGTLAPPATGTAYSIYSTVSRSGITSSGYGTTSTITGYNTNFTAYVNVGDFVWGVNGPWVSSGNSGSWVTAVNSNTSLTVFDSLKLR